MVLGITELVPPLYLPKPWDVAENLTAHLLVSAGASVARCLVGMTLGLVLGTLLHVVAVGTKFAGAADVQFAASRAIPVISIAPLFAIWFGFSEVGRVVLVALASCLFLLGPLHSVYQHLPRQYTIVREQLRLSLVRYYCVVALPAMLPSLEGPTRLIMAIAFTIAIASEYVGAQYGIGKFIDSARITFNVPGLFAAIIAASCIGIVLDWLVRQAFERVIFWRVSADGAEGNGD